MPSSFIPPAEGTSTPKPPKNAHGSDSPEAPPYSPITPPLEAQRLPPLGTKDAPPQFMEKPPEPVDLDMSTNTDAMALRAALSALQVQRLKAVDDMKTLEKQKSKALSDPNRFARGVADGTIKSGEQTSALGAALSLPEAQDSEGDDDDEDDEMGDSEVPEGDDDTKMAEASSGVGTSWGPTADFGTIPAPQNVVRMPPINWAKYKVVGEPLNAISQEQQKRPDPGQLQREQATGRAQPHMVAAPYSPWRDKLPESSMRTRSDARRS